MVVSAPLGDFSNGTGSPNVTAHTFTSAGLLAEAEIRIKHRFGIGFQFNEVDYKYDEPWFNGQVKQRYEKPGYYTTVGFNTFDYYLDNTSVSFSYVIKSPIAEIEPYVLIGQGHMVFRNAIDITSKKMNDNYSEVITLGVLKPANFFYPGVGIRLSKKVYEQLIATAGIQYNYGQMDYQLLEEHKDYLDNTLSKTLSFSQSVSTFQFVVGLQLGLKWPNWDF